MSFPGNLSLPVKLGCLCGYIQMVVWIGRWTDLHVQTLYTQISGLVNRLK